MPQVNYGLLCHERLTVGVWPTLGRFMQFPPICWRVGHNPSSYAAALDSDLLLRTTVVARSSVGSASSPHTNEVALNCHARVVMMSSAVPLCYNVALLPVRDKMYPQLISMLIPGQISAGSANTRPSIDRLVTSGYCVPLQQQGSQ